MFYTQSDFWYQVRLVLDERDEKKTTCPRPRPRPRFFSDLFSACGIATVAGCVLLPLALACIDHDARSQPSVSVAALDRTNTAHRVRSPSSDSIAENLPSQVQLDEATLLQQLSTVPELCFVDDDQIREAKKKVERSARSRERRRAGKEEVAFVEQINHRACGRAENAGLRIKWEIMDRSDRMSMVSLSSTLRSRNLVGVDHTKSLAPSERDVAKQLESCLGASKAPHLVECHYGIDG